MTTIAHLAPIEQRILSVRGEQVMLDSDLASLYGVGTKALNQAVRRNRRRFPADFMFRLTEDEWRALAHFPDKTQGGRRYLPYAFTELGAGMLASVIRSDRAVRAAVQILRAFARLRQTRDCPPKPDLMAQNVFAAIRDAVLLLPEDVLYTTSVSYTYFLQAGTAGPIKIGSTRNLPVRLRTLFAMSPVSLRLLGVIEGGEAEESCHCRFGAFRVHGEWFAPAQVLLDFIRANSIRPERVPADHIDGDWSEQELEASP